MLIIAKLPPGHSKARRGCKLWRWTAPQGCERLSSVQRRASSGAFFKCWIFSTERHDKRVVKGYHQFNGELALVRFSNARLFSTERHNKKIFGKLDKTQTSWFFVSFKWVMRATEVGRLNMFSYLIFVIFLHKQNFWRIKFTPKKRANYDKIHRKLPIFCVITAKYTVNCQFFALNL